MNYPQRRALVKSRKKARRVVADQEYVDLLAHEAARKQRRYRDHLGPVFEDLSTVVRLLRASTTQGYRGLSLQDMVVPVAALMYFVNPLDVVPDFLVGPGLLDDVAIMVAVFSGMREALERFRAWEHRREEASQPRVS